MALSEKHNDHSPDTGRIYAWLSRDEDGIEGIIAVPTGDGPTPLIVTDEGRGRALRPLAEMAATIRGFPAVLVAFNRVETLMEVQPGDGVAAE